jgi:hypothetical protein
MNSTTPSSFEHAMDFNRAIHSATPINTAINELIETTAAREPEINTRQYLGASSIGSECLRRVQFDWMVDSRHSLRTRDIFHRGHVFERLSRQHLINAGFRFAPDDVLGFNALDGLLRGHADGIIIAGPGLPGAYLSLPCVWEHKCLGSKGWKAIERDGLERAYPQYHAQVLLYQAYLDVTNPALFTITIADTCERLHLVVPFNAERAQAWSDRAVSVIEATRAGELLPRFTDDAEDWRCRFCGHGERCWGGRERQEVHP